MMISPLLFPSINYFAFRTSSYWPKCVFNKLSMSLKQVLISTRVTSSTPRPKPWHIETNSPQTTPFNAIFSVALGFVRAVRTLDHAVAHVGGGEALAEGAAVALALRWHRHHQFALRQLHHLQKTGFLYLYLFNWRCDCEIWSLEGRTRGIQCVFYLIKVLINWSECPKTNWQ